MINASWKTHTWVHTCAYLCTPAHTHTHTQLWDVRSNFKEPIPVCKLQLKIPDNVGSQKTDLKVASSVKELTAGVTSRFPECTEGKTQK